MKNYSILGIDQGSSATKAVLINEQKEIIFNDSCAVNTKLINNNQVEQDPEDLLASVKTVLKRTKDFARSKNIEIKSMGLSCQRSGVLAWDCRDGRVLHALISHRDTRNQNFIDQIKVYHHFVTQKTGLPVIPNYAATKIRQLQQEFKGPYASIGTLDSYLLTNLSRLKSFHTEDSMAARTMLYDLSTQAWANELCDIFKVQIDRLPEIRPSFSLHAEVEGIPLLAMLGDQQAALYGQASEVNVAVLNLGTIASFLVPTGQKILISKGLIPSVWFSKGKNRSFCFQLEGVVSECGERIDAIFSKYALARDLKTIDQLCRQDAGASQCGDTVRKEITELASAVSEKLMLVKALKGINCLQNGILVSGGVSGISYLLELISSMSKLTLIPLSVPQSSAYGAALAAMKNE